MPEDSNPNQSYNVWLPLLLSGILALGIYFGHRMAGFEVIEHLVQKAEQDNIKGPGRVEEIIRFIESKYVGELDSDELIEHAIEGIMQELDPHSMYLSPETVHHLNEQMSGSYEGIGIETIMFNDTVVVVSVLSDSPAETAGIVFGDMIIRVNDTLVSGVATDMSSVRARLYAEKGDTLDLRVMKPVSRQQLDIRIQVNDVHIPNIFAHRINDETAYIKIKRFNSNTYREFMSVWEDLYNDHAFNNMIIDVRQNPGGYLPETSKILSQLFDEKGKLLVYTEGANSRKMEYKSTGKRFYPLDKISILVDESSASGSEILAGAIQDWDRGIIVGRRTFGKGLVQEQYNLSNGGALRLTVAKYYTPTGRLIQRAYEDREIYEADAHERMVSGELTGVFVNEPLDSMLYQTKEKKRKVYGGGGISPDIFIPVSELKLKDTYFRILDDMPSFSYQYLNDHSDLRKFSLDSLMLDIPAWEESVRDAIVFFSARPGYSENELNEYSDIIKQELKAQIAYYLYGESGRWAVSTKDDEAVDQSLYHFKKKDLFAELN